MLLVYIVLPIPMGVVRGVFIGILALLALWVLTMPAQYSGETKKKVWPDLRLFAL